MGLLVDRAPNLGVAQDERREAAKTLESMLVKLVLQSSGAFRGSSAPGASLHADLFAETLADAVSRSGGFGLADLVAKSMGAAPQSEVAAAAPGSLVAGASRVSSGFGARVDPLTGAHRHHHGVDVAAAGGTPILAMADGVVESAGERGGYGNAVTVRHPDGVTSLYAHAAELLVRPGDTVRAGQPIATVGSTGRSTGDHLHFEIRERGRPVDPTRALKAYADRAEEKGRKPLTEARP